MRFLAPDMAQWLLVAPLAFAFWFLFMAARRRFRRQFEMGARTAALSRLTGWRRDVLVLLASLGAIGFLVLALMQPQVLLEVRMPEFSRQDLILILDRSASMRAEDVRPSRFARAVHEIKTFIDERPEGVDRVALVGFAGTSVVLSQFTRDASAISFYLDWSQDDYQPQFDTDIGAALAAARDLARKDTLPSTKVFIVLSDGEDHGQRLQTSLMRLQAERTRVHTIGIGSPADVPIPIGAPGAQRAFLTDESGKTVTTRFSESTLADIAARTGGRYYRSVTGAELAGAMRDAVGQERRQVGWTTTAEYRSAYRLALAAGAFCTLVLLLIL